MWPAKYRGPDGTGLWRGSADRVIRGRDSVGRASRSSGGPRICIGATPAITQAVAILAVLAQQFPLELIPGQTIKLLTRITLRPERGIQMKLEPGRPGSSGPVYDSADPESTPLARTGAHCPGDICVRAVQFRRPAPRDRGRPLRPPVTDSRARQSGAIGRREPI
jgi:hypothetical protein